MFRRNKRHPDQSDWLAGWVTLLGTAKRSMEREPHPEWPAIVARIERRVVLLQKVVNARSDVSVLSPAEFNELTQDDDLTNDFFRVAKAASEARRKEMNEVHENWKQARDRPETGP